MRRKIVKWKESLVLKHLLVFTMIILFIVGITTSILVGAMSIARQATYDKMQSKGGYFLQTLDSEISHIRSLQQGFFNDRKLSYLSDSRINISPYEKREALLSVKERLESIEEVSSLVGAITLYLPRINYVVTSYRAERMDEEDRLEYEHFYGYKKDKLHAAKDTYFMLENGIAKDQIDENSAYLMVVTFSKQHIAEKIKGLEYIHGDGAFFCGEEHGIIEGTDTDSALAKSVLSLLEKDAGGIYLNNQRVVTENENYLVFVDESQFLGPFVQYARERPIMYQITKMRDFMFGAIIITAAMAIWFIYYTKRTIHQPMKKLLDAFANMKEGRFDEHITHGRKDEFGYLYDGFNDMEDQINYLVNEVLVQKNLVQKMELKQLQAQINPHFLYNSFFVLSRRVKRKDYENAERFAVLLGNYFKFITRSDSDFIFLEQEAEHAKCYAEIQGTRFVRRIKIEFGDLPDNCRQIKVPRLILQPLLENAFEHGLENRMENGVLRVMFLVEEDQLQIHVQDNGDELTDDMIHRMRTSLSGEDDHEITGIVNIHKRLMLYYEGQAGLSISRADIGGLDICIWIKKALLMGDKYEQAADCR